ncbi:hypothetical protein SBRY_230001 [Actinacidiphila bryophytorum]|uniref:Uncharacterized protein n=1 Tax=Actinacidiphila bryophytorum TaxID=1436133 RepID=A0A9W4H078_9ACTN|nr:hypothetical protein SBRY_230001 [Actinacidiphila bryophytorum]
MTPRAYRRLVVADIGAPSLDTVGAVGYARFGTWSHAGHRLPRLATRERRATCPSAALVWK